MNKLFSLIFNSYDEQGEANNTIASARAVSPPDLDVVLVDDGSPLPIELEDKGVTLYRPPQRLGCGPSRMVAAALAKNDWVFIVDSHCRFDPGWYEAVLETCRTSPIDRIWCGTCVGLTKDNMDMAKAAGAYSGATMLFTGPDKNKPGAWNVMEPKWQSPQTETCYEIPCVLGACYLVHRDWLRKINALGHLRMWSTDEASMSLRSWLMGGDSWIHRGIRVGHQFKSRSIHSAPTACQIYNKLRLSRVCLPEAAANVVFDDVAKQYRLPGDVAQARRWLGADAIEIEVDRMTVAGATKKSFEQYMERFSLTRFW